MKLRTLVLNADAMPLTIVSWRRAIRLVYEGRVQQLDFYAGHKIHDTKGRAYTVPAVVMKVEYVKRSYQHAPFCKKNIYLRDQLVCQYCGNRYETKELTFDHVIPRSKWKGEGTPTCWENIVTCCLGCNRKKANKTCEEARMFPLVPPYRPSYGEMFLGLSPFRDKIPNEWIAYIKHLPLFKGIDIHAQETPIHR